MKKNNDCGLTIQLDKDSHHIFVVPFWSENDARLRVFLNGDYAMMLSWDHSKKITGMPFVHPGISKPLQHVIIVAITKHFIADDTKVSVKASEEEISETVADLEG